MLHNTLVGYKKDTKMRQLLAKAIVPDRFWIIERDGEKVGTLRYDDEYILTVNKKNVRYPDQKSLSDVTKISFDTTAIVPVENDTNKWEVHNYPTKCEPYNGIFDIRRKLPLFTKTPKSQSFFCAVYYIIQFENGWVKSYCPKLITLSRNNYRGPYNDSLEMQEQLRKAQAEG